MITARNKNWARDMFQASPAKIYGLCPKNISPLFGGRDVKIFWPNFNFAFLFLS